MIHRVIFHFRTLVPIVCLACSPLGFKKPVSDSSVEDSTDIPSEIEDTEAGLDSGTDDIEPMDCSAIASHADWELCEEGEASCAAVFYDGAGCHELCASVGLGCEETWENIDGECQADTDRLALGCEASTGHQSDYCLCSGEVTETPEELSETEPYEDLFDELLGFGAATTGGKDGNLCMVTSTSNSGSGSLRGCIGSAQGPTWVRFAVDGDINLNSDIALPNNITIDARDHYVRIFGGGLTVYNRSNVIVTNLIFKEGPNSDDSDAIQVKGGSDIWIHHCSFSDYYDGLVDLTKGTTDVTVSWSKFSNHDKVMLISANDNDTQDQNTRVTLHHNWFKETRQRHPRIRHGKVHAFNNYFDRWGVYAMGCSTDSQCYSENNVFEAGDKPEAIITRVGVDRADGEVESHGDLFLGGAVAEERGAVFTPSDYYSYSADGTEGLSTVIEANAGARH